MISKIIPTRSKFIPEDRMIKSEEYKRSKLYSYYVYFEFENGIEVPVPFFIRFAEKIDGHFIKRRLYFDDDDKIENIGKLSRLEKKLLKEEISKFIKPKNGQLHYIESNKKEYKNPEDDSFFGAFLF